MYIHWYWQYFHHNTGIFIGIGNIMFTIMTSLFLNDTLVCTNRQLLPKTSTKSRWVDLSSGFCFVCVSSRETFPSLFVSVWCNKMAVIYMCVPDVLIIISWAYLGGFPGKTPPIESFPVLQA